MMKKKAFHMETAELTAEEIPEASSVIALAMSTNPLHLAIFKGADTFALQKQIKLFEFALKLPKAKKYSVKQNDQIIGVMAYSSSKYCQLRPVQLIKAIPAMYVALGASLLPVLKWRKNWGKQDCRKPHLHFGPLAIHPQFQGKGIGHFYFRNFAPMQTVPDKMHTWKLTKKKM